MRKERFEGLDFYYIPHDSIHEQLVFSDVESTSKAVALDWAAEVNKYPNLPETNATGATFEPVAKHLKTISDTGAVNFENTRNYHLDEYHVYPPSGEFSFVRFLKDRIYTPLGVKPENVYSINGLAKDPVAEASRYDELVGKQKIGRVNAGLGPNAHIGFTEGCIMPLDTFLSLRTHYQTLSPETVHRDQIERKQDTPEHAITQGPANIMEGDRVVMVFYGPEKGRIWGEATYGPITSERPAGILRNVGYKVSVFMDEAAAVEVLKAKEDFESRVKAF